VQGETTHRPDFEQPAQWSNRERSTTVLVIAVVAFLAFLVNARATNAAPLPDAPIAPPVAVAPAGGDAQGAATDQAASAGAAATASPQTNVVVVVRINIPGDDVITQTNGITVDATASNESSTSQDQASAVSSPSGTLPSPVSQPGSAPVSSDAQSDSAVEPQNGGPLSSRPQRVVRGRWILAASASSSAAPPAPVQATAVHAPKSPDRTTSTAVAARRHSAAPARATRVAAALGGLPTHVAPARASNQGHVEPAPAAHALPARWLAAALRPVESAPIAAQPSAGSDFTVLTLAALLAGLLAWAALAWLPPSRRFLRLRARG
jgi:hypothetical protein